MAVKSSFINMTVCLLAICLVCSGLLAAVYALTAEPIAAVASIHYLAIAELLCVALGIVAVAFLPKRKVIKES